MINILPFEKIKRKMLIKKQAETNQSHGKKPEDRTIEELLKSSVFCLNKPSGPTSHQTVDYVKKILKLEKAGHSGTLDPKVTGVLPIALGEATKITQVLLPQGKEYICLMHAHKKVSEEIISISSKKFIGKITQLPPVKSAVKRQIRQRKIYYLEILEIKDQDVLFKVGCQAGTYIRKLCYDWGEYLKIGSHMLQLIRTKAGPFNDKEWHSLYELKDAYELYKECDDAELKKILKPIEFAVQHLPKVWVIDSTVDTLCHGASLSIPGISKLSEFKENEQIAVLTLKDELICLGTSKLSSKNIFNQEKGLATITEKVFMKPDTYPKFIKN